VVETLNARGVTFLDSGPGPVRNDGPVKLAFFHDPDGNVLYLCQMDA
jgi:catechol 2,3-dioxygenase-like lactoylglutathione lyase family enzyme